MGIINPAQLTFNGEEIKALSEAIMTSTFEKPELAQFHTVVTGIKAKKQIAILGLLGLTGKKQTGCAVTPNAGVIPMSQKFWTPQMIGDRFQQCYTELLGTFFAWGLKNGVAKADLTGTDFANFLEDRLGDAIKESVFRLAWFGDVDATNYNGVPAGVITNGTDVGYFTAIDGLWKQIFAIVTATPARKITIAKNAGANYAAQEFTAADVTNKVATNLFRDMVQKADQRLRSSQNKVIICTRSLADQYENELESVGVSESFSYIQEGISTLTRKGITIYAFDFWDRMINSYQNNGTKWNLPHRAVLTTIENIQIGTEEETNLAELDPFYDKSTKLYNVDFGYNLDAKVIEDYKIQAAY
jgi:hypothetical protein